MVILDLPARFPAPVVIDFHGGNQSAQQEHGYTGLGPAGVEPRLHRRHAQRHQWPVELLRRRAAARTTPRSPRTSRPCWPFPAAPTAASTPLASATAPTWPSRRPAGCRRCAPSSRSRRASRRAAPAPRRRIWKCTAPPTRSSRTRAAPPGSFADVPSEPVAARLPFWTAGCSGPAAGLAPAAGTQVQRWACAGGRAVQLFTVDGGGHTWPGAAGAEPAAGLGARATWSADTAALEFFLSE